MKHEIFLRHIRRRLNWIERQAMREMHEENFSKQQLTALLRITDEFSGKVKNIFRLKKLEAKSDLGTEEKKILGGEKK